MRPNALVTGIALAVLSACMPPKPLPEQPNPAQPVSSSSGAVMSSASSTMPLSGSGRTLSSIERTLSGGILQIGHERAGATATLYISPTSRYSQMFLMQQWPNVLREFVDKGSLKIDVVPFVLQKEAASLQHAYALLCAAKQGRGRMMLEALARTIRPTQAMKDVQADTKAFDACVVDQANRPVIESQQAQAKAAGIALVPSIVIDGKALTGLAEEPDLHGWIRERLRQN